MSTTLQPRPTRRSRLPNSSAAVSPLSPRIEAAVQGIQPTTSPSSTGSNGRPADPAALFDLSKQPGYYNAEHKVALLRRAKQRPHDELRVDFHGSDVLLNLQAAGQALLGGAWTWRASVAGQGLQPTGAWEESCWHRDADADYLELELALTAGWRLERQMLLARKDRFLFVADAVIGPPTDDAVAARPKPAARNGSPQSVLPAVGPAEIRFAASLPLAATAAFAPAEETREGWLACGGKRRATVVPPSLAEWRAEFCHAELKAVDGRLTLEQAALGRRLYAPLFIDLDPNRFRRPLTWRRLTVAEHLEIVPRDVAVAYRVQIGREQWLFYRSLSPRGNRTFLGQNYSSEFVCTRLLASGEAKDILTVE